MVYFSVYLFITHLHIATKRPPNESDLVSDRIILVGVLKRNISYRHSAVLFLLILKDSLRFNICLKRHLWSFRYEMYIVSECECLFESEGRVSTGARANHTCTDHRKRNKSLQTGIGTKGILKLNTLYFCGMEIADIFMVKIKILRQHSGSGSRG